MEVGPPVTTVCIIFIGSVFIDTETFPWVWFQVFSGMFTNRTYVFDSPSFLWNVVARMPGFVILPVAMNTLIGFKVVPEV